MAHTPSALKNYIVHPLQASVAFAVYLVFRLLPIDLASALGGFMARTVGPQLKLSMRARNNLRRAFPDMSAAEVERIVQGMWDNLGRLAAEFPHLRSIDIHDPKGRVHMTGAEHVDALRDDGKPGIFYSGHLGNWEIVSLGVTQRGLPVDLVYRQANNRLVEWLYRHGRAAVDGGQIPKGPQGVRMLLNSIKGGGHLAMMVDQKMNDGVPVPFFGQDVMTAPALAELALRYDFPVVGGRVTRLKGARFQIDVLPPVRFESTGDKQADIQAALTLINAQMETWIRETPEQWLWLHNRFPGNGM